MKLVCFHDVEQGLAHARVSADHTSSTTSDKHALDLATAEHERLLVPLREKLTTLDRHSATARAGLEDTTRTLQERETRLASLEDQNRSTAAAIAVAERAHVSFLSGFSVQQPAPTNPATVFAPAAR